MSGSWGEWLVRTRFAGLNEGERAELLALLGSIRDRVLAGARLGVGDDVLDLGAGTGLLTFGALPLIGDGWVYAVDASVDSLEQLLRTAHELAAPGVAYLVGDAEVLPLPDACVDACVTRSVLMYVDDLAGAARELVRVLRPGGRVSLFEPVNRSGTYLATVVDWGELDAGLAARVRAESEAYAASSALMRLDPDALADALRLAGLADVSLDLEAKDEGWVVDERGVDLRLDSVAAPGDPSLRARWQAAFAPEEVDRLVAYLHGLAGTTLVFRRCAAWVTARKP